MVVALLDSDDSASVVLHNICTAQHFNLTHMFHFFWAKSTSSFSSYFFAMNKMHPWGRGGRKRKGKEDQGGGGGGGER